MSFSSPEPPSQIEKWSMEDVHQWLITKVKVDETTADRFIEDKVSGDCLVCFTKQDLLDMDLKSGPAVKILEALHKLNKPEPTLQPPHHTNADQKLCKSAKCVQQEARLTQTSQPKEPEHEPKEAQQPKGEVTERKEPNPTKKAATRKYTDVVKSTVRVEIQKILVNLSEGDFKTFNFYLRECSRSTEEPIPWIKLEGKDTIETANLLTACYGSEEALQVTLYILHSINQLDLACQLKKKMGQLNLQCQSKEVLRREANQGDKLKNLLTCGGNSLDGYDRFVVVVNKSSPEQIEYLQFLSKLKLFCVLDFDPNSVSPGRVCHSYRETRVANLHFPSQYQGQTDTVMKDLNLYKQTSWVFCNGRNDLNSESNPELDYKNWLRKTCGDVEQLVSFICAPDVLPRGRRSLIIFLLLSPVQSEKDPIFDTYKAFLKHTEEENIITICESQSIYGVWRDLILDKCECDIDQRSVYELNLSEVNGTIMALKPFNQSSGRLLPSSECSIVVLRQKDEDIMTALDILCLHQCEKIYDENSKEFQDFRIKVEGEFYRGGKVKWWNFYFCDKDKERSFVKRDKYENVMKLIRSQSRHSTSTCVQLNLFHNPGCGGTTLAMHVMWDLRKEFRCAVLKDNVMQKKDVANQVLKLMKLASEKPTPVLLLVDDSKEPKNLQDLVHCIHKVVEEECSNGDGRDDAPNYKVIIINCVRSHNPKDQYKHTPAPCQYITASLNPKEQNDFEKKLQELKQTHEKPENFYSFMFMKSNFDKKYVDDLAHNTLENFDFSTKKARLFAFLALLNTYVAESEISISLSAGFLGIKMIHWYKDRMEPFSNLIIEAVVERRRYKGIRMLHHSIASACLEELDRSYNLKISEIAMEMLHCDLFFSDGVVKHRFLLTIQQMLIERQHRIEGKGKEQFSNFIDKVHIQQGRQAVQDVLVKASSNGTIMALGPFNQSSGRLLPSSDCSIVVLRQKDEDIMTALDILCLHQCENIYDENSKEFQDFRIKVEGEFYREGKVKWWNFYFCDKDKERSFVKRDKYENVMKLIRSQSRHSTSTCVQLNLFHNPGCGGTTLAMHVMWDLRKEFRCAVLKDNVMQKEDVAIQVLKLMKLESEKPTPVSLLVDDSKEPKNLHDLVHCIHKAVEEECSNGDGRDDAPNYKVIIINCVRSHNPKDQYKHNPAPFQYITASLNPKEQNDFEKKLQELKQTHEKPENFYSFMFMKSNFDKKYVDDLAHNTLENFDFSTKKARLFAFLALLKTYVAESEISISLSAGLMGIKMIHWYKDRMEPFSNLIIEAVVERRRYKGIRMLHHSIASACLEELDRSYNLKISEIAMAMLHCDLFFSDGVVKHRFLLTIQQRQRIEGKGKEQFSNFIDKVHIQQGRQAVQDVLVKASSNGTIMALGPFNQSSGRLLPSSDCSIVVLRQKDEDIMTALDILCLHQFENIYDENSKEFQDFRIKVEGEFYRGGKVKWWNFYFCDKDKERSFVKRDKYENVMKLIRSQSRHSTSTCVQLNLFHNPGCGGTTLAMHVMWDLRQEFRCAVLKDNVMQKEDVAIQVRKLMKLESEKPTPVLLLVDDSKEPKNLHDLVHCIHKAVVEECSNGDGRDDAPNCKVIIINCVRSHNPKDQYIHNPAPFQYITASLNLKEQNDFEKKLQELKQTHEKPINLYSFMFMKSNFDKKYVDDLAHNTLENFDFSTKKARLFAFLALLNTYVAESEISISLSAGLMGIKMIHWYKDRMEPFSNLIIEAVVERRRYKGIRMLHHSIASACLEELDRSYNLKISEIAMAMLHCDLFFSDGVVKHRFLLTIQQMLIERQHRIEGKGKEQFSNFIDKVHIQQGRQAVQDVLVKASSNGTIMALGPFNQSSGRLLPSSDCSIVVLRQKDEDIMTALDILCLHQCENIYDENSKEFQDFRIKVEGEFYREGKVKWWNFYFCDKDKERSFVKRDKYENVMKLIRSQSRHSTSTCVQLNLFHNPGCGGTTLAMHVMWDLRKEFRCAVLKDNVMQKEDVAIQVLKLMKLESEKPTPVSLLVDDSKEPKNLHDLVHCIHKAVEEECSNGDGRDDAPNYKVIIINCVRSHNPKDQYKHNPAPFQYITASLNPKEQNDFEKKLQELKQTHEKPENFYSFMFMKSNFDKKYVDDLAHNTLENFDFSTKKARLFAFLALLKTYVAESEISISLSAGLMGIKMIHWYKDRMEPFSNLIIEAVVERRRYKGIRMLHHSIASACLEELDRSYNLKISEIAMAMLHCDLFFSDGVVKHRFLLTIQQRQRIEGKGKEQFSNFIDKVHIQQGRQAVQDVLVKASSNGTIMALGPFNQSSGRLLPSSDCSIVVLRQKDEDIMTALDILCLHQFENIYDENSKEFQDFRIKVEGEFYRGGKVKWWNFYFCDKDKERSFVKRDKYENVMKLIRSQSRHSTSTCVQLNLFHNPGCGGTTLAMHVMWDLRQEFRCAVLKDNVMQKEDVAIQVRKLMKLESEKPTPVLLLVDDSKEPKNLHDLVHCIHKAVVEECSNGDGRDDAPNCKVIIINCVRSHNPKDQYIHNPAPCQYTTASLNLKEQNDFEKKLQELKQTHEKPENLYSFMFMKSNFDKKYVDDLAHNTLENFDFSTKKARLFAFLALLNTYVAESEISISLSAGLMGIKMIHWYKDRMEPFSNLIIEAVVERRRYKGIRMLHHSIASACLEELDRSYNLKISEIAMAMLHCDLFFSDGVVKHRFLLTIQQMLIERQHRIEGKGKEQFSNFIDKVHIQQGRQAVQDVLVKASSGFEKSASIPQALARYLYINEHDFPEALIKENPNTLDTVGQVYKNSLKSNILREKQETSQNPEDLNTNIKLADNAIKAFKRAQELENALNEYEEDAADDDSEDYPRKSYNVNGFVGVLEIAFLLFEILGRLPFFEESDQAKKKYLLSFLQSGFPITSVYKEDNDINNRCVEIIKKHNQFLVKLKTEVKTTFDQVNWYFTYMKGNYSEFDSKDRWTVCRLFKRYVDLFCTASEEVRRERKKQSKPQSEN